MRLLIVILGAAFLLDYFLGDPEYPLHPVRGIGGLIRGFEHILRRAGLNGLFGGSVLLLAVVAVSVIIYGLIRMGLASINEWAAVVFDIFTVYSCLALKDMVRHALPIADVLDRNDVSGARELVGRIVGRDTSELDFSQIARATVESVGESFVDGFLAPVFWFLAFGIAGAHLGVPFPCAVAGIIIYRCINTLDSMVGYRNEKYDKFGRFSARADDVLNFIPARLSLLLFVPAALLCGMDARKGWRTAARDRLKHASPNAAHAESFLAGVLDLRLGGPTTYSHGTVDKPWLGTGTDQARSTHITGACRIVTRAGFLSTIIILVTGYFC